jgi:RNA polymerase nonessential primary-like sigma factor
MLSELPEREAEVLRLRFGLFDGQRRTLDQIGKTYGVHREQIRDIELAAMTKLRAADRHVSPD